MKKKEILQKTWVVCALALISNAFWGSAFPSVKIGYQLFAIPGDSPASQIFFAGLRFTLAGILAVLIGSLLAGKMLIPKKSSWGSIAKLSVFQTMIDYIFFYQGLAHITGVKGAIIGASSTFISILMASFLFRTEKMTGKKILACAIGFAGVLLVNINGGGFSSGIHFNGEGFMLISVCSGAVAANLLNIYSKDEDPVVLSGYQFILGGVVMAICGYALGGRVYAVSPAGLMILFHLAVISSVAFSLWGILLEYNPVSKVTIFGFCTPVFGVLFSAMFLKEENQTEPWKILVSLILVSIGILLLNYQKGAYEKTKKTT